MKSVVDLQRRMLDSRCVAIIQPVLQGWKLAADAMKPKPPPQEEPAANTEEPAATTEEAKAAARVATRTLLVDELARREVGKYVYMLIDPGSNAGLSAALAGCSVEPLTDAVVDLARPLCQRASVLVCLACQ